MLTRPFQFAIVMTGLALAAPQVAWADSPPSLIRCTALGVPWVVTKTSPATGGKVKIFDVKPKYTWGTGNVDTDATPPVGELKEAGETFELKGPKRLGEARNYWMVCFPKDTVVDLGLSFVKDLGKGAPPVPTTLTVKGFFHNGEWRKKAGITSIAKAPPEVEFVYPDRAAKTMAPSISANFGKGLATKGKADNVFLTLN